LETFIIDDDNIIHFLTTHTLKAANYPGNITSFLSAREALECLLPNILVNVPQVIFLDLNMPEMNGWEFLAALAPYKYQLLNQCRIYILTSSLDMADIAMSEECELVGGYINKPLDQTSIKQVLDQIENMYEKV